MINVVEATSATHFSASAFAFRATVFDYPGLESRFL